MREYKAAAPVEVPPSARLTDVVFRKAQEHPGAVLLRRHLTSGGWQDVTASQFCAEVTGLAKGLIAAGLQPGDRVGLLARTCYEWTLIDYAIWTAAGVTVPIYETSSADQVEWILGDSAARAVFMQTDEHEQIVSKVAAALPGLRHQWRISDLSSLCASGAGVSTAELDQRRTGATAETLATIVYTSGTTGQPKGCPLTHANLLADVRNAIAALPEIFGRPDACTLLFLPLAHVFARIIEVGVLEAGAVLGHWEDLATVADGLVGFRPTFLLAVPRVFEKMYAAAQQQASASRVTVRLLAIATDTAVTWSEAEAAGRRRGLALRLRHAICDLLVYRRLRAAVGGRLMYAISGGAPLLGRLALFFSAAGIHVLEGYGMTESTGAATVNRPPRTKVGTVGPPLPGVAVRIAPDGEILLSGRSIFAGYWRNEPATRAAFYSGGWLRTGDIGTLDDEGFLRVTGRQKDLIVTAGGINVAPAVLEDQIRAHPLVSQCMVIGDGRPYVACLITLDPEALGGWKKAHGKPANATVADLASDPDLVAEIQEAVDQANRLVSRAESIRKFRILDADFSVTAGQLTPSDKVRRSVVAADFAADIAALYGQPA